MSSITLLSISLFILKGAAIGARRPARIFIPRCMLDEPHSRWAGLPTSSPAPCRRHGRLQPGHVFGDRLGRHPGDAPARYPGGFSRPA